MKRIFTACAAVLLLAGCSGNISTDTTDTGILVTGGGSNGSISVVAVPNGDSEVTCAVLIGAYKGGISCDWEGSRE